MDRIYLLKWWFTAIAFVAPAIIITWSIFGEGEVAIAFLAIPFGLFYSLPTLATTALALEFMRNRSIAPFLAKLILNIIVLCGLAATFYLIDGTMAETLFYVYAASVILSSLFFRISRKAIPPTSPSDIHSPQ